jgi:hypothetical protein
MKQMLQVCCACTSGLRQARLLCSRWAWEQSEVNASDLTAGPDEKRQNATTSLEEVITFGNGMPPPANVGPVAASAQQPEGRFASLVSQVVRPAPAKAAPEAGGEAAPSAARPKLAAAEVSHAEQVKRLAQEEFRKFVEHQGRSSSFYDDLPPPSKDL